MLQRLIESRPQKRHHDFTVGSTVAVAMLHTAVIWVGVVATSHPPPRTFIPIDVDTLAPWVPQAEDRREGSLAPLPLRSLAPPPQGLRTVAVVTTIPEGIPPVELSGRLDPQDYLGRGIEGSIYDEPSRRGRDGTNVFTSPLVDEPPERLTCPPIPYPQMLREGSIEGSVTLQFVVDRAGQVVRESIVVMRSSRHAFEPAARSVVEGCRFRPGRVGADSVRVLVEMSVTFSLRR